MTLMLILLSSAAVAALSGLWIRAQVGRRAALEGGAAPAPFLTTPVGFVVVAALVVVVGVVLVPQLLGFTFFLLPFLWSRTAAKRRRDGEGGWFPGGPDA